MGTSEPDFPAAQQLRKLRFSALRRAWGKRCPQCGAGDLFLRYARLRERCAECGLVLRREQGAQTGSMYLTAAITQLFAIVLVAVGWSCCEVSAGVLIVGIEACVIVFSLWFLPHSQALWVAIEYLTDAVNREVWVEPRE